MIYSISAWNPKHEELNMPLSKPEKSGINVINVTGITPVGGEIYITPFGSVDGGLFAGARVPSRNIVLTLGMHPEEKKDGTLGTIEEARLKTYNFFRIKDYVDLVFYTDNRQLIITGYVESNDVDIFSEKETATISIICVSPWFHTVGYPTIGFSGNRPRFSFPFSSEKDGKLPENLLEFGNISIDTKMTIFYNGDIQTGFRVSINFLGSNFKNIYLYNMDTRERMVLYTDQIKLMTGQGLDVGDEIQLSTISGEKYAFLLRNGAFTNVISMVDKNSTWFQLTKGANVFAFACDYGVDLIDMRFNYEDRFAGI